MTTIADEQHLTSPGAPSVPSRICRRSRCARKELDGRTDLFSFGAVLYEMATVPALCGESSGVIFDAILDGAPLRRPPESRSPRNSKDHQQGAGERPRFALPDAAELRTDLKRLKRDAGSAQTPQVDSHSSDWAAGELRKRQLPR